MQKCNKKFLVIFLFVFSITFLFISCAPKKPIPVKPQVDETTIKGEEKEKQKAEEETRLKAEEEARQKAEEETRLKAEEEARLKAEEEAKRRTEEEAKRKVYEEARLRAKEEAKRRAEEETKRMAEEEARLKAKEEKKKIEEERLSAIMETEAQPLAVRETEVKTATALEDIYFDFNKYDIRTDGREILQQNAEWLQKNPDAKIQIEGHCDERGTTEYNLALGERRAMSVKKYLISLGISAERLYTISYGEELPIDPGHNEDAWVKNRRGHFLIIKP